DLIYRHLTVTGTDLASPQDESNRAAGASQSQGSKTQAEVLLGLVDIFASLTAAERAAIAAKLKQHSYDEGEKLLEPGALLQSLFFVGTGVLPLSRNETEGEMELIRLGPGDPCGEIGLLTGAPSVATITTLTPAIVYELAKGELAPMLEARPEVSH